jgi:hypothetical protein
MRKISKKVSLLSIFGIFPQTFRFFCNGTLYKSTAVEHEGHTIHFTIEKYPQMPPIPIGMYFQKEVFLLRNKEGKEEEFMIEGFTIRDLRDGKYSLTEN